MEQTTHETDDQLEQYVLGRLEKPEAAVVEEHLIMCSACQERLDIVADFALGMKERLLAEREPGRASTAGGR